MKKQKRGMTLAVNYVFLFLIAVIVMMIVIALVSKSSLNANHFLCKLTGNCQTTTGGLEDAQIVNVSSCSRANVEIVKHAELCYNYGQDGKVRELCYALNLPNNCNIDINKLRTDLNNTRPKIKFELPSISGEKILISYDYKKQEVTFS